MMKTPISYYGGKMRLAKRISDLLPANYAYVEAFAGSAAVLLSREPSKLEVLNDLDGEVYNFWKVLREEPDSLVSLLERTPYSKEEYLECRIGSVDQNPLERARRFFVKANMAFGASLTTVGYSSGSLGKSSKPAIFISKVEMLEDVARRLRGVELQNEDALRLINRFDSPRTSLYLDPPYLGSTRSSSNDYIVDNASLEFHESLISRLKDFSGNAVLSGYAHPLYEELGWLRIDIDVHAPSSGAGRRTECLWVNL